MKARDMDALVGHWGAKKEEPQTTSEVCRFSVGGNCIALEKTCNGKKTGCSFFKTEEQFRTENDAAITRCRKLGLCDSCKYRPNKKCHLSEEPQRVKGVRND